MIIYLILVLILILLIIILWLIFKHIKKIKKINNNMNIIQACQPSILTLQEFYLENSPIILQKEIQLWDKVLALLGKDCQEISSIVNNSKNIKNELNLTESIKIYLSIHNLPFSYDWNIDITSISYNYESPIFVTKQDNLLQLYGTLTGESRIILIPPSEYIKLGNFNHSISDKNIKDIINQEESPIEFIEIIVREGNMIYIPYNWHYYIYSNNSSIMLNCRNISLLSKFQYLF